MSEEVIVGSSLCVRLNNQTVLDDVNFSVGKGEIFALLGGNGAGKSTTLKTFLGTVFPSSGTATVMGLSVTKDIELIRQKVAYLPESVILYGHLTGIENIKYFLALANINGKTAEIAQALQRVALQEKAWHQSMANYSKGMRQKTVIALALLRKTPILFLDDPNAIDEFNPLIATLAAEGTTVFMVLVK